MNDVYLKAAKHCAVGDRHQAGMCNIIEKFTDSPRAPGAFCSVDTAKFQRMFKPRANGKYISPYWAFESGLPFSQIRDFRVTMLLLAHAMRQTGDL